jgi:protein phosphatase
MISDAEIDQGVTKDVFEILHFISAKRLALERLTVIDAISVQPKIRRPHVEVARKYHCLPVAIVLALESEPVDLRL